MKPCAMEATLNAPHAATRAHTASSLSARKPATFPIAVPRSFATFAAFTKKSCISVWWVVTHLLTSFSRSVMALTASLRLFASSVGFPKIADRKFAPIFATAVCILSSAPSMVSPAAWAIPEALCSTARINVSRPTWPFSIIFASWSPVTPSSFDSHDNGMFCSSLENRSIPTLPVFAAFRNALPMFSISPPEYAVASETTVMNRFRSPVFVDSARVAIPNALSNANGVPSTVFVTTCVTLFTSNIFCPVRSKVVFRFFSRAVAESIALYRSKPLNRAMPTSPIAPVAAVVNATPSALPATNPALPETPSKLLSSAIAPDRNGMPRVTPVPKLDPKLPIIEWACRCASPNLRYSSAASRTARASFRRAVANRSACATTCESAPPFFRTSASFCSSTRTRPAVSAARSIFRSYPEVSRPFSKACEYAFPASWPALSKIRTDWSAASCAARSFNAVSTSKWIAKMPPPIRGMP